MSQPVKIVVKGEGFTKALRAYKQASKKSWEQIFAKTAKELAAKIVRVTPPFDVRGSDIENDAAAKRRGQDTIAGDLSRVFTSSVDTLRKNGVQTRPTAAEVGKNSNTATMRALHSQLRNNKGRVPKSYKARILVKKMALARYIKLVQRRVGYLGAGWERGATITKARTPSWVKRHSAPSQATVSVSENRLIAEFRNNVPFAGLSQLQRRVDFATSRQAAAMMKQVAYFAKKRVTI